MQPGPVVRDSVLLNQNLEKLRNLPEVLAHEIKGQDHALAAIVAALRRGELGLTKPGRPRGSFLLLGPTGVGKTETAIVATEYLFGPGHIFRFDMSEYQTPDSVRLLLGGNLSERGHLGAIREKASEGGILLDEIEKAHPRVLDLLLQLLDAARLTMATGETHDFSGFYIWLTSNVGAADLLQLQHSTDATLERHVLAKAQTSFRPEIFARITEKLVFHRLGYDIQLEIAAKFLRQEVEFLRGKGIELEVGPEVLTFLVRKGFHPKLGARPMRQVIERLVGDAVAQTRVHAQPSPPGRFLHVEAETLALS